MNVATDTLHNPVLKVTGLSKGYKLYGSPRERLYELVTGKPAHKMHWAVRDLEFSLYRGQCLGVVGNNGAGKSTLLKLLAGTLHATLGQVHCPGRITAILELGAGFHPDFSGRENLHFAGALIGLDAVTLLALEQSILDFAELGSAIDRPVKTYSSGMVVRLAFALVTAVQPELLIVDEALAVGDQNFQKKCIERIEQFRKNGCTILFCSHSLYHVRQLCDVALWLDKGQVRAFGEAESVLASYEASLRYDATENVTIPDAPVQATSPPDESRLLEVWADKLGAGEPPLLESPDLVVTVRAKAPGDQPPSIGIMLEQAHGAGITSMTTHAEGVVPRRTGNDEWEIVLTFPELPLHTGEYALSAYLFDTRGLLVCDEWRHCIHFKFLYPTQTPGLVRLPHHWS